MTVNPSPTGRDGVASVTECKHPPCPPSCTHPPCAPAECHHHPCPPMPANPPGAANG